MTAGVYVKLITELSARQLKLFELAVASAKANHLAQARCRHAAIFHTNKLVVLGKNRSPSNGKLTISLFPPDVAGSSLIRNMASTTSIHHAEIECLYKASKRLRVPVQELTGTLTVVRVNTDNQVTCSIPCAMCRLFIRESGVRKVFFSLDNKLIGIWDTRLPFSENLLVYLRNLSLKTPDTKNFVCRYSNNLYNQKRAIER